VASWPTLAAVRTYLRLQPEPGSDAVIQSALAAAVDFGVARFGKDPATGLDVYPPDATTVPDSAYQACLIHAARLSKRRDSTDGTIGFGDLGVIRVGRFDVDAESLYVQHAPMVFG